MIAGQCKSTDVAKPALLFAETLLDHGDMIPAHFNRLLYGQVDTMQTGKR